MWEVKQSSYKSGIPPDRKGSGKYISITSYPYRLCLSGEEDHPLFKNHIFLLKIMETFDFHKGLIKDFLRVLEAPPGPQPLWTKSFNIPQLLS